MRGRFKDSKRQKRTRGRARSGTSQEISKCRFLTPTLIDHRSAAAAALPSEDIGTGNRIAVRLSLEMTSSLAEFLVQIGAGELGSTVILPKDGIKPPLAALHDRLQTEIDSIVVS